MYKNNNKNKKHTVATESVNKSYRVISIYNHKGGVGKTTITRLLADALSDKKKVLIIDIDPQMNITSCMLGESAYNEYINDINDNTKSILSNLTRINHFNSKFNPDPVIVTEHLHLIPGYPNMSTFMRHIGIELQSGDGSIMCHSTALRHVIQSYCSVFHYDVVMLDLGPDLYDLNKVALWTCDHMIIPCTMDSFSVNALKMIHDEIFDEDLYYQMGANVKVIGYVINKVSDTTNHSWVDKLGKQYRCLFQDGFMCCIPNTNDIDINPLAKLIN